MNAIVGHSGTDWERPCQRFRSTKSAVPVDSVDVQRSRCHAKEERYVAFLKGCCRGSMGCSALGAFECPISGDRALVGRAGPVPLGHLRRAPAEEAHDVAFL